MNHKYVSLLQLILAQDTYDNAWREKKYTKQTITKTKMKIVSWKNVCTTDSQCRHENIPNN